MADRETIHLTLDEARGLMLAAQGLLDPPPSAPTLADARAMVERLGVLQVDTISVVERSQYLVLWSRLGAYDRTYLDALVHPERAIFEYWSHAASLVPMSDYPYYRPRMLNAAVGMWGGDREWLAANAEVLRQTLDAVRVRGPLTSADFERPDDGRRAEAWDWYGLKESRRALQILWLQGELMVHSRRGGQKVYDLRERLLAEVLDGQVPADDALPDEDARTRHFIGRNIRALGVLTPSWLWDYFRITPRPAITPNKHTARGALDAAVAVGMLLPAVIEGIGAPAYLDPTRLPDLERLRAGLRPGRTTLLTPFDSLIWHRTRTRALFGYEVVFEAYVLPAKRRYGYYCLAILHQGRLVGRLDPRTDRAARRLEVRAAYLEPGVVLDEALLDGLAGALEDLARFVGAERVAIERAEPTALARGLRTRLRRRIRPQV